MRKEAAFSVFWLFRIISPSPDGAIIFSVTGLTMPVFTMVAGYPSQNVQYEHNDMEDRLLKLGTVPQTNHTDGSLAWKDLANRRLSLARKYNARILVDDAHGIGVLVANGRGAPYFGVEDEIDMMLSANPLPP